MGPPPLRPARPDAERARIDSSIHVIVRFYACRTRTNIDMDDQLMRQAMQSSGAMTDPQSLGAVWGFTRPFERISRFWRIYFIPNPQK